MLIELRPSLVAGRSCGTATLLDTPVPVGSLLRARHDTRGGTRWGLRIVGLAVERYCRARTVVTPVPLSEYDKVDPSSAIVKVSVVLSPAGVLLAAMVREPLLKLTTIVIVPELVIPLYVPWYGADAGA